MIVLSQLTEDHDQTERNWIAYYRHYNPEHLTNGTDGGADLNHAHASPKSIKSRGSRSALADFISEMGRRASGQHRYLTEAGRERAAYYHEIYTELVRRKKKDGTYQAWVDAVEERFGGSYVG